MPDETCPTLSVHHREIFGRLSRRFEERVDKDLWVERGKIVWALAESDELDGYTQFALHLDDDAALRGPVQLGQYDARHVDNFSEDPRLGQAVLPSGRIKHEQHFTRSTS